MTPALRLRLREHADKIEFDARDQSLRRLWRQIAEVIEPYGFRVANVADWSSQMQVAISGGLGWVVRHQANASRVVFVHWDRYRPGLSLHLCDELLQEIAGSERPVEMRFDPGADEWGDVEGTEPVELVVHAVLDVLNGEGRR